MSNRSALNLRVWFPIFCFIFLAIAMQGCSNSSGQANNHAQIDVADILPVANVILLDSLSDNDPRIRSKAIEVVATTRQVKLMPRVQKLLADDFVPVRFQAILAVGDLQYTLATDQIKALLKDHDQNIQIAAAYALNKLGEPEYFQLIRKALANDDQTVRANAALLLGKNGDKSVLKFLYWTLSRNDSGEKVRFQTTEAIAMLGDEQIYPKLWALLISSYADDRVMGIMSMGALGSPEARNALITMLDDSVPEVRLAAAEQLGRLGGTTGELEVLDVFQKNLAAGLNEQDTERLYMRTALAIGRIATPNLTKYLAELLKNDSKIVRLAVAKALFQAAAKAQNRPD